MEIFLIIAGVMLLVVFCTIWYYRANYPMRYVPSDVGVATTRDQPQWSNEVCVIEVYLLYSPNAEKFYMKYWVDDPVGQELKNFIAVVAAERREHDALMLAGIEYNRNSRRLEKRGILGTLDEDDFKNFQVVPVDLHFRMGVHNSEVVGECIDFEPDWTIAIDPRKMYFVEVE